AYPVVMVVSRIRTGLTALLATALLAGCTANDSEESLPDADTLLTDSAESIAEIDSAHVALDTTGEIPGLPVTALDGDLRRNNGQIEVKGSGTMQQMGQLVEVEFVLTGDTLYLKGP